MKRLLIIISAIFCVLLAGCTTSSYTAVMAAETRTLNGWESTYKKLDGTKSISLTVPDGEKYLFSGVITTNSGSIYVQLEDNGGNVVFTSETYDGADGSFETMLESGSYKIKLAALEHSGSIELEWLPVGAEES